MDPVSMLALNVEGRAAHLEPRSMGIMLINVTQALGEMAIMFPVSGGFYTLAVRFIDPSWGFAMVSTQSLSDDSSESALTLSPCVGLELRLPMGLRLAARNRCRFHHNAILDDRSEYRHLDHRLLDRNHPGQRLRHPWLR